MAETEKPTYRADADKLLKLPDWVKAHPYFCLWKWEYDKKRDAWTKVPYDPNNGRRAKSTDKGTFSTLEYALDVYSKGGYDGIGIGLFGGLSGIDIDHHLDANGNLDEFAQGIVDEMDGYTEISPSGDGVHVLFACETFATEIGRDSYKETWLFKNSTNGLETYVSGLTNRFLTITGATISAGVCDDKSDAIRRVLDQHMKRKSKRGTTKTSTATSTGASSVDDDKLIAKAKASKKNGDKFTALWSGDTSGYGSQSEADQALCDMLSFWTGKDAERIDRLFRLSGLYREKWEREDYRNATISKAIEDTTAVYDPNYKAIKRASRQTGAVSKKTAEKIDDAIEKSNIYSFEPNDLTLARGFAEVFGHIVRYVADAERFYVYDGKRWACDSKASTSVARYVKIYYERLIACAPRVLHDKALSGYLDAVLAYGSYNKREHLLKDARSELVSHMADFDLDLDLLNVRNGTLDLRTFELRPHDPADRITRMADVDFDPTADCDEWKRFLLESLEGDVDVYLYLQQQLGVTIAGDTSQEHMHLLYGRTRSGKSTTVNTVKAVLGDYACGISPATITKQRRNGQNASEDLARLAGIRMGVVPEPQQGMELSAEVIKTITGNDTITARQLYQGSRDFTSCINLWVATNHLPQIDDPTVFDSDRIVIVPFDRHLELNQRDKKLKSRLLRPKSKSGILNWLIEGLRSYREDPLPAPETVNESTSTFNEQSDRVKVFINECLVKDDDTTCPPVKVWEAWQRWANSGNADPNKGKQEFYNDLRRLGVMHDRYKGVRNACVGYRLPDDQTTV